MTAEVQPVPEQKNEKILKTPALGIEALTLPDGSVTARYSLPNSTYVKASVLPTLTNRYQKLGPDDEYRAGDVIVVIRKDGKLAGSAYAETLTDVAYDGKTLKSFGATGLHGDDFVQKDRRALLKRSEFNSDTGSFSRDNWPGTVEYYILRDKHAEAPEKAPQAKAKTKTADTGTDTGKKTRKGSAEETEVTSADKIKGGAASVQPQEVHVRRKPAPVVVDGAKGTAVIDGAKSAVVVDGTKVPGVPQPSAEELRKVRITELQSKKDQIVALVEPTLKPPVNSAAPAPAAKASGFWAFLSDFQLTSEDKKPGTLPAPQAKNPSTAAVSIEDRAAYEQFKIAYDQRMKALTNVKPEDPSFNLKSGEIDNALGEIVGRFHLQDQMKQKGFR